MDMIGKMKKINLVGLILLFGIAIYAQNLEQKKQQLDDLNQQIVEEDKLIQEVEKKKKSTQKDIYSTKSKKDKAEIKIKQLLKSESSAKNKLDSIINELDLTNHELSELHNLCELEFNKLCLAHYLSMIYPERKMDTTLLSSIIKQTAAEINTRDEVKSGLQIRKSKNTKKYEDIIWTRIVTNKKKRKYSSQVTSLNKKLTTYTNEEKEVEKRIKELRKQAEALDELITKLQADIVTEDYSYKFSTPKLIWPAKGKIIKLFGQQRSDQYKVSVLNNGINIGLAIGSDIVAVDDGIIAFAEWYNGAGKLIVIDHQNGFHTLYSHNSKLLVSKGDVITRAQVIALSGMTGSAEVPSVHFELRKRGTPINPLEYLE